ncbi:MAG: AAA family ATPase [Acidobacteria bacterium SCN 69-37]|nr:MAG: AAA family ATPase [Acidobacteria bacterium SCN 69-37]
MARSDLLVSLVKAGTAGDRRLFRSAAEAIIAEERAKRHNVLADQLVSAIQTNGSSQATLSYGTTAEPPTRSRDVVSEIAPRRQLSELVLPPLVRRTVEELVEEQHRADVLRAHSLEPRHRVLMVGAPGTGKTTLAEAIACETGVPLFVVRYEAIIGSYLGETASRLKRVFDYARTTPCVLFFDEFDAIGKERGDIHETGEIKRVVTSLLMQMDDLPSYTLVTAATNHPELLDRASWRRFQLRLSLPLPDAAAVGRYIASFSARFEEPLGQTPAAIAKKLGSVSFAEAEQFCLDVQRRAVLAMGARPLKSIVSEQLEAWSVRAHGASKGGPHGRTTTAKASRA